MTDAVQASSDRPSNEGLPTAGAETAYRVLARKYRPQSFAELIGQEALVRTLTNAIESGRVAQAYVLTGVRGVGKTTTARILAKALNYAGPDGKAGPTAGPTDDCPICRAIAEDRQVDVIEMDAASRTGVDGIRELIDGVRYRPVEARYKVYIIDEVHMLSTQAFNALLKTLEEPPPHVVFIFATTEIRKVPVTVLSRCQRFDLRRVEQTVLAAHFRTLAAAEGVAVEDEAIQLIARAADGSVRDGLSLLDQAIALTGGQVGATAVRAMLGLADRGRLFDLLEATLGGRTAEALAVLQDLYDGGSDPIAVLQDLLEAVHLATRIKLVPATAEGGGLPEIERRRGAALAERLSLAELARAWQILLKGHGETQQAPLPLQAAEMVLIRLAHASDLPTPGELVRQLQGREAASPRGGGGTALPTPPSGGGQRAIAGGGLGQGAPRTETWPAPRGEPQASAQIEPSSFAALVGLARQRRELQLVNVLESEVALVRFASGELLLRPLAGAPADLVPRLQRLLGEWTGRAWRVALSDEPGEAPLRQQRQAEAARQQEAALQHPLAQALLSRFPGARLVAHRRPAGEAAALPEAEGDATSPEDEHLSVLLGEEAGLLRDEDDEP